MNEYKEQIIRFFNNMRPQLRIVLVCCALLFAGIIVFNNLVSSEKKPSLSSESLNPTYKIKGFELFDENIWMKGEKEIEILNLRALKGQLERDLLSFEFIERATVILDGASKEDEEKIQPKASLILKIRDDRVLNPVEIHSILYYLTGAVKNLKPYRIALSDSTGRLYTSIVEEFSEDAFMHLKNIQRKQEIKNSIEQLLTHLMSPSAFYCVWGENQDSMLSLKIVVNNEIFLNKKTSIDHLLKEVYENDFTIKLVPFEFQTSSVSFIPLSQNFTWYTVGGFLLLIGILCSVISNTAAKKKRNSKKEEDQEQEQRSYPLQQREVPLEKEQPEHLLETFSRLDLSKREAFINSLSFEDRSELLLFLSKEDENSL